ncbi:class E sortase [Actinomadura roseirufa]|uniref:class E sortase n=1 Tax=Actinomadura roseirufa TaxID=2094049 RepID=UPI001041BB59|nr:class E sortase [Actinomadura roseirufa]
MDYPPPGRRAFDPHSSGLHAGAEAPPARPNWARRVNTIGEVLVTLGLVVLLFGAYEFWGKAWRMDRDQHGLDRDLDRLWAAAAVPRRGEPIGRLYIPRLHKKWVVVNGVGAASLAKGPGLYPGRDRAGDVGNVAIAGHRMPSVFWNLDRLRTADPIIAETRTGWYVYRVVGLRVVRPTQVEVVARNPDRPGARPGRRLMTLTTCNPKFENYQRLVVRAELSRVQSKRAGRPAELSAR